MKNLLSLLASFLVAGVVYAAPSKTKPIKLKNCVSIATGKIVVKAKCSSSERELDYNTIVKAINSSNEVSSSSINQLVNSNNSQFSATLSQINADLNQNKSALNQLSAEVNQYKSTLAQVLSDLNVSKVNLTEYGSAFNELSSKMNEYFRPLSCANRQVQSSGNGFATITVQCLENEFVLTHGVITNSPNIFVRASNLLFYTEGELLGRHAYGVFYSLAGFDPAETFTVTAQAVCCPKP